MKQVCINKTFDFKGSSMRLIEVGTKELSKGNKDEANQFFKPAFDLYSLFFAINLKITDKEEIKSGKVESKSTLSKFSEIIKKIDIYKKSRKRLFLHSVNYNII